MSIEDRQDIKSEEYRILRAAKEKYPDLFAARFFVEDDAALKEFGIFIPEKKDFPKGYLKLWPQDFIVEEIGENQNVYSVEKQNLISADTPLEFSSTLYATLVKCGLSTIEVAEDLAKHLECERNAIGFAGIKDKDALTAQRISFRKISRQKIKSVSSPYFFLKDPEESTGSVATASLTGNRFTILVRTSPDFFEKPRFESFIKNLKNIQANGFYNFFYLQRFGTPRLINYIWALSILRGEYEKAVIDIITHPATRELGYFQELRKLAAEHLGDWSKVHEIFSPFPIIFRHELKVISHLEKSPDDFLGALMEIPDQVSLWIYALASKYFNEKISESIEENIYLPPALPLFLSFERKDWQPYEKFLKRDGIFPPSFKNLKPFPTIQMRHREVPTKDHANILGVKATKEGIILSFELSKGQYATTFLSHLFNLINGKLPENFPRETTDIKAILGEEPLAETLEYFQGIIHSKIDTGDQGEEL